MWPSQNILTLNTLALQDCTKNHVCLWISSKFGCKAKLHLCATSANWRDFPALLQNVCCKPKRTFKVDASFEMGIIMAVSLQLGISWLISRWSMYLLLRSLERKVHTNRNLLNWHSSALPLDELGILKVKSTLSLLTLRSYNLDINSKVRPIKQASQVLIARNYLSDNSNYCWRIVFLKRQSFHCKWPIFKLICIRTMKSCTLTSALLHHFLQSSQPFPEGLH